MENRKTFINIWSEFLHQKGLSNYQSVKTAMAFADQMEELNSQLSGSNVWVKASERLPEKDGLYFAKYYVDHFNDWVFSKSTFRFHKGKWLFNEGEKQKKDIEWLDETPIKSNDVGDATGKNIINCSADCMRYGQCDGSCIEKQKSNDVGDVEKFKDFWYKRNPVHELNADSGEDMFLGTAELVAREYAASLKQKIIDVEKAADVGIEITFYNGDSDSFQINCLDEDNEMPVCVRSNSKKTKYNLSISEATELVEFISYHLKNENSEWQSNQQPLPITIKDFITMVKNSDAEIKKLVMDELGVEQKEPVDKINDGYKLLRDLLNKKNEVNEDSMPVAIDIDKPKGGTTCYLRHDAVVKYLNK